MNLQNRTLEFFYIPVIFAPEVEHILLQIVSLIISSFDRNLQRIRGILQNFLFLNKPIILFTKNTVYNRKNISL